MPPPSPKGDIVVGQSKAEAEAVTVILWVVTFVLIPLESQKRGWLLNRLHFGGLLSIYARMLLTTFKVASSTPSPASNRTVTSAWDNGKRGHVKWEQRMVDVIVTTPRTNLGVGPENKRCAGAVLPGHTPGFSNTRVNTRIPLPSTTYPWNFVEYFVLLVIVLIFQVNS